jgi:hypothetical protein
MEQALPCKVKAAKKPRLDAIRILIALSVAFGPAFLFAQKNPLNRKISIKVRQKPLEYALDEIADEGKFSFSYNSDLFPTDSLVNVQARREPVKNVLEGIFGQRMVYRPIGNHVVIRSRKEAPLPYQPPETVWLEGYLIDGASGEHLPLATVFENFKRTSALTDAKGYYRLEIPGEAQHVALSFSKRGYRDTVIVVRVDREKSLTVGLNPIPGWDQPVASRPVSLVGDGADDLPLVEFLVPESQRKRAFNVRAALRDFPIQISLVPSLGTNKLISGAMNNNFSLNILGGYANGVRGVEIGGLFNIDREHMIGFQAGGLFNVVGGNVKGMQAAGLFSNVSGSVTGVQASGLYNMVRDTVYGVQAAGLFNQTKGKVTGLQIGGLYNMAMNGVDGGQIAGVYNHSREDVRAMQIAGVANLAKNVGLFQIAGISNVSRGSVKGFQISGISNVSREDVSGVQISGIFNKARTVGGVQIGLINVADSVGGAQIGLLNFNKHGYTSLELSTNEVMQANLAYKAGNRWLYSILTSGLRFTNGSRAWSYGAGLGTMADLGALTLGFELLCQQINEENLGPGRLNLVIPGRLSLGLKLGRYLELFGGASVNLHVTSGEFSGSGNFPSQVPWNPFWTYEGNNTQVNSWVGYQGGLRINLHGMKDRTGNREKKRSKQNDAEIDHENG